LNDIEPGPEMTIEEFAKANPGSFFVVTVTK